MLDVAYRTVDSPFGQLLVAATAAGVVRVAFEREGHDVVLAALAAAVSPRILRSPRRTEIDLNGFIATIGRSDTVTGASLQDPVVASAMTITCGDLTIDQNGVRQP